MGTLHQDSSIHSRWRKEQVGFSHDHLPCRPTAWYNSGHAKQKSGAARSTSIRSHTDSQGGTMELPIALECTDIFTIKPTRS